MTTSDTTVRLGEGHLVAATFDSPVGELVLVADDDALVAVLWPDDDPARVRGIADAARVAADGHPVLRATAEQLDEYFDGRRTTFDLPLRPAGTPFQQAVWRALVDVPYGETTSYGELARRIGRPGAVRAVGLANGRNPISIVVPCHRIIGSDGSLTGYGGGLERKRYLLDLERGAVALALALR